MSRIPLSQAPTFVAASSPWARQVLEIIRQQTGPGRTTLRKKHNAKPNQGAHVEAGTGERKTASGKVKEAKTDAPEQPYELSAVFPLPHQPLTPYSVVRLDGASEREAGTNAISINMQTGIAAIYCSTNEDTNIQNCHLFNYLVDQEKIISRGLMSPLVAATIFWRACVIIFLEQLTSVNWIMATGQYRSNEELKTVVIPHDLWKQFKEQSPTKPASNNESRDWIDWSNNSVRFNGIVYNNVSVLIAVPKPSMRELKDLRVELCSIYMISYVEDHPADARNFVQSFEICKTLFKDLSRREFEVGWIAACARARELDPGTAWGRVGAPRKP